MSDVEFPTGHRPWLPPDEPWIMWQEWHDLLFAHWAMPVEALRSLVPSILPLDTFDGQAWIGITPFHITDARPRTTPTIPWISNFPELNVRTYVTLEGKPGVYFFSLDAGNPLAVTAARTLFHLPYFTADMDVQTTESGILYSSHRTDDRGAPADFIGRYRPTGDIFQASPGTLEYFLAERYCLYTLDDQGTIYRCEIHHRPWPLQPAEAEIQRNTMAAGDGIALPDSPPLLHFARHQPTIVWRPMQV